MTLEELYHRACISSSDMQGHCSKLRELASQCGHVTEFGVRHGVSTVSLLAGLTSPANVGTLVSYDDLSDKFGAEHLKEFKQWDFRVGNSLKVTIEPTDMLMIDTVHTGNHLYAELTRHQSKVRKWIAMHDTELYGDKGDDGGEGMRKAINRFLLLYPFWWRVYHSDQFHGLTVLERSKV